MRKVLLALLILVSAYPCLAKYSGGSGTTDDPYLISTAEDLNAVGVNSSDWGKCFKLISDINMAAYTGIKYKIIGNSTTRFTGTFDGNEHIIRNLTYTAPSLRGYVGLFGYTQNATVKNLGLEDVNFYSGADYVGGLVGRHSGVITNCYSTGSNITTTTWGSRPYTGGLVGYQYSGTIMNCYSTVSVTSSDDTSYAGGLVGYQYSGTIMNCYSTGAITVTAYSSSYIYTGGLVGYSYPSGEITNCYSTGVVTAIGSSSGRKFAGGLVGYGGIVMNSFWDIQTSGLDYSAGGNGRTTEQLKQATNYIGWNTPTQQNWTINEGVDYPRLSWENQPGIPLPAQVLSDFIPGAGTTDDPYRISTPQQLNIIGLYPEQWDKVFILENDIDLSEFTGIEFNRIGVSGNKCFSGTFDGNEHIIRNLTYTTTAVINCVGLFGDTNNATIKNLGLVDVNLSTGGIYAGGLVGWKSYGTITNCYSTGSVTCSYASASSFACAGGLVGYQRSGIITDCYSICSVAFSSYNHDSSCFAGGLVGYQESGTVTGCYGTGSVASSSYNYNTPSRAGGIVGYLNDGNIIDCHSTGSVTSFSSSSSYAGGLAGYQYKGAVTNCYCTGSITATASASDYSCAGGLVGSLDSGTITDCYSTGSVTSSSDSCFSESSSSKAGGLAGGQHLGTIMNCYSTGSVTCISASSSYAGGLLGSQGFGTITNCYSISPVTSSSSSSLYAVYAGGFVGYQGNDSSVKIEKCYSIGQVSATGETVYKGGFLGYKGGSSGIIAACFWDIAINPDINGIGNMVDMNVIGQSTELMQTESTFTDTGWDFVWETANGPNDIWAICEGVSYPKLAWQFVVGDSDNDKDVNFIDFAFMGNKWMQADLNLYCGGADLTGDGWVDLDDLAAFVNNWLQ